MDDDPAQPVAPHRTGGLAAAPAGRGLNRQRSAALDERERHLDRREADPFVASWKGKCFSYKLIRARCPQRDRGGRPDSRGLPFTFPPLLAPHDEGDSSHCLGGKIRGVAR